MISRTSYFQFHSLLPLSDFVASYRTALGDTLYIYYIIVFRVLMNRCCNGQARVCAAEHQCHIRYTETVKLYLLFTTPCTTTTIPLVSAERQFYTPGFTVLCVYVLSVTVQCVARCNTASARVSVTLCRNVERPAYHSTYIYIQHLHILG